MQPLSIEAWAAAFPVRGVTALASAPAQMSFNETGDAIARVDAHANPDWKTIALAKVRFLCETCASFNCFTAKPKNGEI